MQTFSQSALLVGAILVGGIGADARADEGQAAAETASRTLRIEAWPDPATSRWDARLRTVWQVAHDGGDGILDAEEVVGIPCAEWAVVDGAVAARWGSGVWTVYGVDPMRRWVGGQLGIDASARTALGAHLDACGLAGDGFRPADALPPDVAIVGLPLPGEAAWDEAVRARLLDRHDGDGNGWIDGPTEVAAIPCLTWHLVDARVRRRWEQGVYLTYGMADGLVWLGDALGIPETGRASTVAALVRCGVPEAGIEAPLPSTPEAVVQVVGLLPEPGSRAWTDLVRALLVRVFDTDGSEDLGAEAEVRAVPCTVWNAVDAALAPSGGLVEAYGFEPGARWRGWKLGVEGAARATVLDALTACGPPERSPATLDAASVDGTPAAPSSGLDQDRSGTVSRAEVRTAPCSVWQGLDARSREARGVGVVDWLGLRRGQTVDGGPIGLAPEGQAAARRALRRCGLR